MAHRLRFGIFSRRPHKPGIESDARATERSRAYPVARPLWLRRGVDRRAPLGGNEIIASPEIFMAVAAERTRHIKLGTGVVSASYHNPLWVAERAVQLDHMTQGARSCSASGRARCRATRR